jgi:hypothetical protein
MGALAGVIADLKNIEKNAPKAKPRAPRRPPQPKPPTGQRINHRGGISSTVGEPKAVQQATRTVHVKAHTRQIPVRQPKVTLTGGAHPLGALRSPARVVAAIRPTEKNIVVPRQPKVPRNAPDSIRAAESAAINKALLDAGIHTLDQVKALPAPARAAYNRANALQATIHKDLAVHKALTAKRTILPKGYHYDGAGNLKDRSNLPVPDASDMPAILKAPLVNTKGLTVRQVAKIGEALTAQNRAQGKKAPPGTHKGGSLLATLTNPNKSIVGAFIKGTAALGPAANQAIEADKALKKTLIGRAVGDALEIPTDAIPTAADVVDAGISAAGGNTKPLSTLAKGFAYTYEHPRKAFKAHPLNTALAFAPVLGGVGRLAGLAARSGALGEAVSSAAQTDRAPLTILKEDAGTGGGDETNALHVIRNPRSKNLMTHGLQVATERTIAKVTKSDPNIATPNQIKAILHGGSRLGHAAVEKGILNKKLVSVTKPGLADQFVGDHEVLRRAVAQKNTGAMAKSLKEVTKKYGPGSADIVPLITEGIVRKPGTIIEDLNKELGRLKDAAAHGDRSLRPHHPGVALDGEELQTNLDNQEIIEHLLKNRKIVDDPQKAFDVAETYGQWSHDMGDRLAELGGIRPEQQRAALFPAAQAHEDAVTSVEARQRWLNARHDENVARTKVRQLTEEGAPTREIAAAQADVVAAKVEQVRWHRLHPEARAEMTAIRGRVAASKVRVKEADATVKAAQKRVDNIIGEQRTKRSSRGGPATKAEETKLGKAQANLKTAEAAAAEQHSIHGDVLANAKTQLKFHNTREITGLRKPSGLPYTTPELQDIFTKHTGRAHPGYLSHELPQEWKGSVFSRAGGRPGIARNRRTGETFAQGTYRRDAETLLHQVYRTSNQVSGHLRANALVHRFGVGRYGDEASATQAAKRHNEAGGPIKFVVHHVGADQTLDAASPGIRSSEPISAGEPHDFAETNKDVPKYTLLPEAVDSRIAEHDALATRGPTVGTVLTSQWRNTALFTSPRWFLGTPQENLIRAAFNDISPLSMFGKGSAARAGKIAVQQWREAAADANLPAHIRQTAAANVALYEAGSQYGSLMSTMRRGEELPWAKTSVPGRATVGAWEKWKGGLGGVMRNMEHNIRQSMVGRQAIRETGQFGRAWTKTVDQQDKVMRDWANGKVDPNEAAALTQRIFRMAGNWSHLTPDVKRAVQQWTPFGLWWKNSLGWVFKVLPQDHPIKLAIIAAAVAGDPKNKGRLSQPGYLGGSFGTTLPFVGRVSAQPTYYSPFGIAAEPGQTMADMVEPQAGDVLAALKGQDPLTGDPVTMPDGSGGQRGLTSIEQAESVLGAVGAGFIPGARQGAQLLEQGGKPLPTANLVSDVANRLGLIGPQTLPGTKRSIEATLFKILSPVKFYYGARATQAAKGAGAITDPSAGAPASPAQAALARSRGHIAGPNPVTAAQAALARSRGHYAGPTITQAQAALGRTP